MTATVRLLVVSCWFVLGAASANADTRVYQAAQVELDLPGGWNVQNRDDGMTLTDPNGGAVVFVGILAASQLEQAIKEADAALRNVVDHVRWGATRSVAA